MKRNILTLIGAITLAALSMTKAQEAEAVPPSNDNTVVVSRSRKVKAEEPDVLPSGQFAVKFPMEMAYTSKYKPDSDLNDGTGVTFAKYTEVYLRPKYASISGRPVSARLILTTDGYPDFSYYSTYGSLAYPQFSWTKAVTFDHAGRIARYDGDKKVHFRVVDSPNEQGWHVIGNAVDLMNVYYSALNGPVVGSQDNGIVFNKYNLIFTVPVRVKKAELEVVFDTTTGPIVARQPKAVSAN